MNPRTAWSGLSLSALLLPACSAADLGVFPEPSSEAKASAATRDVAASSVPSARPIAAPTASTSSAPRTPPSTTIANDVAQHPALKAIAEHHGGFARADGTWWSLLDCAAPPPRPSRLSDADPASPHGRKLYTLQISDFEAYAKETRAAASPSDARHARGSVSVPGVVQAVVKVSYEPAREPSGPHFDAIAPVKKGGETFYAGAPRDLFVMYRPADAKIETDAGWLYGTVAPGGEVTSAGKVATCMGCHASAPHGRLFGPRPTD